MVSFRDYVMAVDRVEKLLRRITAALDRAGVGYAVVGGNAVAAWVARADPSATRATKDVDLLVDRAAFDRVDDVMRREGLERVDLRRLVVYLDPAEPSKRAGVHLVWANELLRPSYACPSPDVGEAVSDPQGFRVIDLPALVRMKLTSFRDIDRVHLGDLIEVGLLTPSVRSTLPPALLLRLAQIEADRADAD